MVQPNSQYGDSVYFPYAAGSLVAYAFDDKDVADNYSFEGFFYKKTDIEECVKKIEEPFLIGFSCYVWNYEYNKVLAGRIKEKYPNCIIVFGGHQLNKGSDIFDADYADYIILGEGEDCFKELLIALNSGVSTDEIPNLTHKVGGKRVTSDKTNITIPDRVSPYLSGLFDDIAAREPLQFSAVLETNRGCPNRCAFCDWGNIKSKVKSYDIKMVFAEIDWLAEHKIEYCYCADANFGLYERDLEIVDYLIKKNRETGFPQKFQATYSKNNTDTVFDINKRLNEAGMCKGATLSFQSMSDKVLKNIYRKNMPLENFRKLMVMYAQNNIAAYSEIILGLPGESYESFRDGIETLLEYGQHMSINFFNCEMLANSIMNDPEYISKYKIETVKTEQHQYHIHPDKKGIEEFSRIVVSTSTMPKDKWIDCNAFSVFIRAFHNLGLLQCFAIYLYYEKEVKYTDFYEALIEWSRKNRNSVCGSILDWLYQKYNEILDGNGSLMSYDKNFGELTWPLDEFSFLKAVEKYDLFYSEISDFLNVFFDDNELYNDLMKYQKAVVKNPYALNKKLSLKYDFYSFFSGIYINHYTPLKKSDTVLAVDTSDVPQNMPDYARRTIWFGRKGGQNIANNIVKLK